MVSYICVLDHAGSPEWLRAQLDVAVFNSVATALEPVEAQFQNRNLVKELVMMNHPPALVKTTFDVLWITVGVTPGTCKSTSTVVLHALACPRCFAHSDKFHLLTAVVGVSTGAETCKLLQGVVTAGDVPSVLVMMRAADPLRLERSSLLRLRKWRDGLGADVDDEARVATAAKSSILVSHVTRWVLAVYEVAMAVHTLRESGEKELATTAGPISVIMTGPVDGPLAILLHGTHGEKYEWQYVWPVLHHYGYRTVAIDMPGRERTLSLSRNHSVEV